MSIVESAIAPVMFHYFEEISKIPRGSGNEKGIADYLEAFANERALSCYRDAENNILIKKPATSGREADAPVLLQGHTDMVCEKLPSVKHDFLTDPLKLYVEDGWLKAKGTTLGADDGIAVAAMLAILDGAIVSHPALECLFTTAEETGMDGAVAFDFSLISARKLLNLDSACEWEVVCGCAGGVRSEIAFEGKKAKRRGHAVAVTVSGLCGGHSGEDIHRGLANANRLVARVLMKIAETNPLYISSICGGSKDNAIPRDCTAEVIVADFDRAFEAVQAEAAAIADELSEADSGFACSIGVCDEKTAYD